MRGADTDGQRPAVSLVCYGSLLSPNELVPCLDTDGVRAVPVRVEGFRRVFNQHSVWRAEATDGDGVAVLNAVRDADRSMNAVLVPDLSAQEYDALRRRERGYRMVEVENSELDAYHDDEPPESDLVLVSTGERVEASLEPIPEYVEVCREGARAWGEEFYAEFLETTEVRQGYSLKEYVEKD